jgi:hypothetical protein
MADRGAFATKGFQAMTFTANYRGRCAICDERIDPGDECTYVDDEICHAECDE